MRGGKPQPAHPITAQPETWSLGCTFSRTPSQSPETPTPGFHPTVDGLQPATVAVWQSDQTSSLPCEGPVAVSAVVTASAAAAAVDVVAVVAAVGLWQ